jgi:hypothetical protein
MKSRRMPHGRVLELQNSVSQFMVHARANETNRRAFKNSTGFERMKDFYNASFPPDTIKVMTLATRHLFLRRASPARHRRASKRLVNGALSTLPHSVSSTHVQSVAETIRRTAKEGSPLVVVGKGLKLTRNRSVGHGLGSAEQSLCCF